jgi:putative oxidoreductase
LIRIKLDIMNWLPDSIVKTSNTSAILLIRLMVGGVFLSEGIQKFLFPDSRGAGRFETIGLPYPDMLGALVGGFEIICGILVLTGFAIRFAVIPLIVIMLVAISTTKVPQLADKGIWETLHASRTDFSMLMGSLFLLLMGAGSWSADNRAWTKRQLWNRHDARFE